MIQYFRMAQRYRITLSGVVAAVLFYLSRPTLLSIGLGFPIIILGELIRTWSSGCIRKNKALAIDGPYAYTRNPLYLGSFIIGLGFVVMSHSVWVLWVFLVSFGIIYWGVIRSEEEALVRTFGSEFRSYVETVPRFIPRFNREPYGAGSFDWWLVRRHREYQAWLGIAGCVGILVVKMIFAA